ncbi:MAG: hypothetical protein AMDU1_APLC00057G0067 [Thermoplasmatales archaeon A-plasma]|nr:MAG: hypothetical protein AMDU1_APLC00057G0067 [Thermoplasmatales archaeon A-plasma]
MIPCKIWYALTVISMFVAYEEAGASHIQINLFQPVFKLAECYPEVDNYYVFLVPYEGGVAPAA